MATKVLENFLPDLRTAISANVGSVSDQCLAKGLIAQDVYNKVHESREINEDKARTLIRAVMKVVDLESRNFDLFLYILEGELPQAGRSEFLAKIRNAYAGNSSKALVIRSTSQPSQSQTFSSIVTTSGELMSKSPLDSLEECIRQHAFASSQKLSLEKELEAKTDESEKLRGELTNMKSNDLSTAQEKISNCEMDIKELKQRIEALESTIEQKEMRVKRSKGAIDMQFKRFLQAVEEDRQSLKRSLQEKKFELVKANEQHAAKLKEKELALADLRKEHETAVKLKDLEHEVALQKKDMEILKLEKKSASESLKTNQFETSFGDGDFSEHDDDDRDTSPPEDDDYGDDEWYTDRW